jgi:hypothetical protein
MLTERMQDSYKTGSFHFQVSLIFHPTDTFELLFCDPKINYYEFYKSQSGQTLDHEAFVFISGFSQDYERQESST